MVDGLPRAASRLTSKVLSQQDHTNSFRLVCLPLSGYCFGKSSSFLKISDSDQISQNSEKSKGFIVFGVLYGHASLLLDAFTVRSIQCTTRRLYESTGGNQVDGLPPALSRLSGKIGFN